MKADEYPPINRHGIIGDRRTGALVAADGTIDWFCTPDFDGHPMFGSLLDPEEGGFCRVGPAVKRFGQQSYVADTAVLITRWVDEAGSVEMELSDVMAWPTNERVGGQEQQRVIIRRLVACQDCTAVVGGLIHRFNPKEVPDGGVLPLGQEEGAFLPCIFWHAHVLAKLGRCDEAERILQRCEAVAGGLALFAEEVDGEREIFLGNTPLLFSHAEYVCAVLALQSARARSQLPASHPPAHL